MFYKFLFIYGCFYGIVLTLRLILVIAATESIKSDAGPNVPGVFNDFAMVKSGK
jgi:hypothetical protein